MKKIQIGVLGFAGKEEYPKGFGPKKPDLENAEKVGELIAKSNGIVVTGGKGGVMEYASKGSKKFGGTTVGVISSKRGTGNEWLDVEVVSGSNVAGLDEFLIPQMCDAVIVIGGGAGTLQEICVCYRNKIPIILLNSSGGWAEKLSKNEYLDGRKTTEIYSAKNAIEAVSIALSKLKK